MYRILAFASLVVAAATRLPHHETPMVFSTACRPADSTTAGEIEHMQGKMHSTDYVDSADVLVPGLLYVADSAFAVVTDSTLCATALAKHNVDAGYTPTELSTSAASTVYVLRIGSRYVTWNPDFRSGEYVHHAVWDSSFNIVSHYLY